MSAYYNEIDPYCAQWLRNLIAAGHIAAGDVDERSIEDVRPDELGGYIQCHFFAGIGVWSYALRLAGWPDDRPVWTGSCPCQPFSSAGKGAGFADERHLWPAWFHLIRERRPPVVFGEQVSAGIRHGWIDLVRADLEAQGYACGHTVLGAHSVGAPHIRQRCFFVADDTRDGRRQGRALGGRRDQGSDANARPRPLHVSAACELAYADGGNASTEREQCGGEQRQQPQDGRALLMGHTDDARLEGRELSGERAGERAARPAGLAGFWRDAEWIACRDGKSRPVEPGTFPLAHGATARVGRLRAYGNAIVAPAAAAFIAAFAEARA